MFINESDYLSYNQCPKSFWLRKSQPEHMVVKDPGWGTPEVYDEIYQFARMLFPGGVFVKNSGDRVKMLRETEQLLQGGTKTIFQATFEKDGIFAIIDVLCKTDKGWCMYAISPTTSLKVRMLDRMTFQTNVASQNIDIHGVYGITLNNQYVRQGELQLDQLFKVDEVTEIVRFGLPSVSVALDKMKQVQLTVGITCDIGRHCNKYDKDDHECPAKTYCWSHIPEYSVFNISRISDKAFDLYRQGIIRVTDIPSHINLTRTQAEEVRVYKEKIKTINKQRIADFVADVQYPIYFLDFETFQMRIPHYDGIKPYQQMTFQYSLHKLDYPGAPLLHKEFLAVEGTDPRHAFAESLTRDIPRDATVFVYSHFESTVLKSLIQQFVYAEHLQSIINGFVDLIILFRDKAYVTPEMKGKSSIKYVLPALFPDDPELNYQKLNIKNGVMAMTAFERLHTLTRSEVENVRQDLLEYCRLDTFAMVKIWEHLNEIVEAG